MMKPTQNIMAMAMAVLACHAAWAAGIDATRAREVALQFLNANSGAQHLLRSTTDLQLVCTAPAQEWYAFNALPGEGYVVVAGDDRFPSVIGYSEEGEFSELNMPENMRSWLEQYADQVRYVQSHPSVKVSASANHTVGNVYPLLGIFAQPEILHLLQYLGSRGVVHAVGSGGIRCECGWRSQCVGHHHTCEPHSRLRHVSLQPQRSQRLPRRRN